MKERGLIRLLIFVVMVVASVPDVGLRRASSAPAVSLAPGDRRIMYLLKPVVASGLAQPLFVTHAGDDRLFIVQKAGQIRIWANGVLSLTAFLDISLQIGNVVTTEQGLLGLAFEPNYASTGRFYVYYNNTSGDIVIARYHVSANPDVADAASATTLLTIGHPTYSNHNGGWMGFGPDGFLYAGVGDGGSGGDFYCAAEDVKTNGPSGHPLLGKMLRLDVVGQITYTTPMSNIFATSQAPEVYALGLRNPWRNSFDRLTGELYIGDVGQNLFEEIDHAPAHQSAGINYGWSEFEGTHIYSRAGGACTTSGIPPTAPILDYMHDAGNNAVTGGYVYRGAAYPWLDGDYFFGDSGSGRIWAAWQTSPGVYSTTQIADTPYVLASFGEDKNGELYVVDLGRVALGGSVYKLTSLLERAILPVVLR